MPILLILDGAEGTGWAPPGSGLMFNPHGGERLFDMFKVQEKTEDKLVTQDSLARDNEGEGKFDSIVECQRVNCYAIQSA